MSDLRPAALSSLLLLALAACSSGPAKPPAPPQDRDLLSASAAAQQAFARGAYEQAVDLYRRALARARLQDDPALIGDQAYNLGICLMAQGQTEPARASLAEAEAAQRRAGLPLADVLLVQARLEYRLASAHPASRDAAISAASRVLDDPQSHPTNLHRAQVALLRAEIACDQGDAAAATEDLAAAQTLAAALPPPGLASGLAHLTARLHLLRSEWPAAAESFDEEARLQRQAHRYPDMAKALLGAAEACAKAGNPRSAADRFYRAALSLTAQEKFPQALAALDSAAAAAAQANDAPLARLVAALRAEVKQAAPLPAATGA